MPGYPQWLPNTLTKDVRDSLYIIERRHFAVFSLFEASSRWLPEYSRYTQEYSRYTQGMPVTKLVRDPLYIIARSHFALFCLFEAAEAARDRYIL